VSTDVDRLHRVAGMMYPHCPHGAGKTYHDCHMVAGAIELGETQVAIVMPHWDWMCHIGPMLFDVLTEHGIEIRQRLQAVWVLEYDGRTVEIRFIDGQRRGGLRGSSDALVDFGDAYSCSLLDANGEWQR
jgi:hypothetical protein